MHKLLILSATLLLAGCDPSGLADKVSSAVTYYCALPQAEREAIRTVVRNRIEPITLTIDCAQ